MKTHGLSKSREYKLYYDIIARCYTKSSTSYKWYGEKGIYVCDEWLNDFMSFYNYLIETIGLHPGNGYSIDRINNNLGYQPNNIRWSTPSQQTLNRGVAIIIEVDGVKLPLSQWCFIYDVNYRMVHKRIFKRNWDIKKALTVPSRLITSLK